MFVPFQKNARIEPDIVLPTRYSHSIVAGGFELIS